MNIIEYQDGIKTLSNFFSESECLELIDQSESQGYGEAAINIGHGRQKIVKDVRNNDRVLFDDFVLADKIFSKLYKHLPYTIGKWRVKELNERFRFYRYEPSQYFKWHRDGSYEREMGEESKLTFMIYLNEDYLDGETQFRSLSSKPSSLTIKPETGMALLFPHRLMHQGCTITSGTKYVLRTDIMYTYS